jgi:hypothetical protein
VKAPISWSKKAADTLSLHTALATHSRVMIDHSTSSAPTLTMITLAWVARWASTSWGGATCPSPSTWAPSRPLATVAPLQARFSTFQSFTTARSSA